MRFFYRLAAPVFWLWDKAYAGFDALHDALVWLATPFGTNVRGPLRRYSILLGIYAVIYLIGALPIPILPLLALGIGYVGVLAVGRAWVKNETQRTAIAKKLVDGDPDALPDLRWTALVSALQLIVLFPLFFQQVHAHFPGLYKVPEDATFGTWFIFTLDAYNKVLMGLFNLYGVHFETAEPISPWGRHLILIGRLTIEWLLIQGVVRLFAIRETIRDAVAAVIRDPGMAVRVGRRTVRPLIHELKNPDAAVRLRAADVLGLLRDTEAVGPLIETMNRDADEGVRSQAARSLGLLGDREAVPALLAMLRDRSDEVRRHAAEALGLIGDPRAVPVLIQALGSDAAGVRVEAARALGHVGDDTVPDHLIPMVVRDPDEAVRIAATGALKMRWRDRAIEGLVEMLGTEEEKPGWLGKWFGAKRPQNEADQEVSDRQRAAEALGELADARTINALAEALQANDRLVRRAAVVALGKIGGPAVVEPLIRGLQDRERDVRWRAAEALGETGDERAVAPLLEAWRDDREGEVRLAAGEAVQKIDPEAARVAGVG